MRKANLDKLIEVTGLDTVPSESDMKQYIEEVIKEMQANKEKKMTQFNGYPEEVILNAYYYSNPNYDLGFWCSHKEF